MCDFFQANPWKPLLCTNCHQNRSGHQNLDKCEHISNDIPSSTSTMHLYEEIMAQYFTTNINPIIENNIINDDIDEDSFSDEEQDLSRPSTIEFIQNQSMISTQGIILMGPNLPTKELPIKKSKKINLLKKSKSNADDCLKKSDIIENNSSKLWWFKVKKSQGSSNESNKSNISTPTLSHQKIRVLPEINKLTLNEALNIARRQHSYEPKLKVNDKIFRSNYDSTTSSSTQSSNEYDTNCIVEDSTYLTAVLPNEKNFCLINIFDKTNKLIIEKLTDDLRKLIEEYKQNLPVARFQTFKSFLNQYEVTKNFSNESIYFLLLQIIDEYSHKSISIITYDHFLITYHSTIPILVLTTSSSIKNDEESIEEFIKNLAKNFFHSSSLPIFNDIHTFENVSYRFFFNQIFPSADIEFEKNLSLQRVKLLELFWNKISSLRNIQINEENERFIFIYYYLMRYIIQSD